LKGSLLVAFKEYVVTNGDFGGVAGILTTCEFTVTDLTGRSLEIYGATAEINPNFKCAFVLQDCSLFVNLAATY
jgi:hypothetical protein